jgi:hypothetical protein
MKTKQSFLFTFFFIAFSFVATAQTKTETIKVSGECGMCKKTIEKAAKSAGASFATWNPDSKELTVKYDSKTDALKIQQAVANSGYDTQSYKATEETYNNLHECCKYERTSGDAAKEGQVCCKDQKCAKGKCSHDGKCKADMSCCKESGCSDKDCCKKGHH